MRENSRGFSLLALALSIIGCLCLILENGGLVLAQHSDDRISLQVGRGIFEGTREQWEKERRTYYYYSFKGIPYAEPPTGKRRWEEPQLREVYGTTKATSFGDKCPQWSPTASRVVGSEDCLFLNIYTPSTPSQSTRPGVVQANSRGLLPVLVYIHGGAYTFGSADALGPRKLMKQEVVLVTFNYRLGVFGFLSTGDEGLPGNYGILDQIAALRWVKLHIRDFGGNPDMVTIFGDSAGAASVNILMMSPRATSLRLFQRAILQSGSALCDWAVEPDPAGYAEIIADALGCSAGSGEELKECLLDKSPNEIIKVQQDAVKTWIFPLRAAPVVDNTSRPDNPVLPDTPKALMAAGAYAQIPVLTGMNKDEGLMGYTAIHLEHTPEHFRNQEYFETQIIPSILQHSFHDKGENEVVTKAVLKQYFEGINVETPAGLKMAVGELTELLGDISIGSCQFDFLETLAATKQNLTFNYVFTHKTPYSPSIIARNIQSLRTAGVHHPLFDYGVSHSDELFYLFDPVSIFPGNLNTQLTATDERVSEILTKIWVSFARNGNPTAALQTFNLSPWRPIGQGNINYYNLTSVSAPMGSDFRKGDALFWLRTVPYVRELGETIDSLSCYPLLFYIFLGLFILFLIISIVLAIILHKKRVKAPKCDRVIFNTPDNPDNFSPKMYSDEECA